MLKKISDFSIKVERNSYHKPFTQVYQPYSIKKTTLTEMSFFLTIDLSKPSSASDFAMFIHHAIKDGFMPVAGPIFRVPPAIEKLKKGIAIIHINVRKTISEKSDQKKNDKLVYVAMPSRLAKIKEQVIDYVDNRISKWIHPLHSLPYEYFEGGGASREETMNFCCKLIDYCDEMWLFGISDGTLTELDYFLSRNRTYLEENKLKILVKEFDPNWKEILKKNNIYEPLRTKHHEALKFLKGIDPSF